MCLLCGRMYCSTNGESSVCARETAVRGKMCPCHWMINTGFSGVESSFMRNGMYPFGSIYYTDRNSTFTKGWPRERMTKSKRAWGILENAIRSDMVWFKTSMYEKVRLYCIVCSSYVKQKGQSS